MNMEELKEELRKLDLKISGSKATLRERLRAALHEDGNAEEEDATDSEDEEKS
jgi:SAP domain.